MGRGIVESGLFRSERLTLEERTSDPSSTQEGEGWIRTDLNPDTDQLATLRFDNGSGTWDVPIYAQAATTDNVSKALRVEVGGNTGFVPVTTSGGTFDALRLQHDGSTYAFHDALEASAIPDSVVLNLVGDDYDDQNDEWTANIGPTVPVADGTPVKNTDALNGETVVECDGGDIFQTTTSIASTDPFAVLLVVRDDDPDDSSIYVDSEQHLDFALQDSGSGGYNAYRGGSQAVVAGSVDNNWHVIGVRGYDTDSMAFDKDGTEIGSGSGSSGNLGDGITINGDGDLGNTGPNDYAELTVLEDYTTSEYDDETQRLADKYGISLS